MRSQPTTTTDEAERYSHWFGEVIGDDELAQDAKTVERETSLSPDESRARIRAAVEKRYTHPSLPPLRAA